MLELLTIEETAKADKLAIAGGVPGQVLMEHAGAAVALAAAKRFPRVRRVVVLAGPGNNGGDGYVAARHLARLGRHATVGALVPRQALTGDAASAALDWRGPTVALADAAIEQADLIIDALFGAGLTRSLDGEALHAVARTRASAVPLIAIDVPSGVHGNTGAILGDAPAAALTVTFFRRKPAHLLLPGRARMGEVVVADIGIPASVLGKIAPKAFANEPALWRARLLRPEPQSHKYTRGVVLVASGPAHRTGAARLAARAALRCGVGLVTVAGKSEALPVLAAQLTAITISPVADTGALLALWSDRRFGAAVLGPAYGIGEETRAAVLGFLEAGRPLVLDADALTSFEENPDPLFRAVLAQPDRPVVMTPHEGEFQRLFGSRATADSKLERARRAAALSGAIVLLKGSDTVIADPDGRAAITGNATADLGTAGSGDALAGVIAAFLAQRMPPFEAVCAAAWIHAEAGRLGGTGLIAEDLPELMARVIAGLL